MRTVWKFAQCQPYPKFLIWNSAQLLLNSKWLNLAGRDAKDWDPPAE